jgi:hypothetical protein
MTSVIYLLLSKPIFHPAFLRAKRSPRSRGLSTLGLGVLIGAFGSAVAMLQKGGPYTYLGLILAWATPVLTFLWSVSTRCLFDSQTLIIIQVALLFSSHRTSHVQHSRPHHAPDFLSLDG